MKRSALLLSMALLSASALAQAPQLINYQGRLIDGTNLVNQVVSMKFRIYTNDSTGPFVYEEMQSVHVVDGLYSTPIGLSPSCGTLTDALDRAAAYLQVVVNDVELWPREQLRSVPYALHAQSAPGVGVEYWQTGQTWSSCEGLTLWQFSTAPPTFHMRHRTSNGYLGPDTFVFPTVGVEKTVRVARCMVTRIDDPGPPTNRPSLALEVRDFSGSLVRTVSSSNLDLRAMGTNVWFAVPLRTSSSERRIGINEYLCFHTYDTAIDYGDNVMYMRCVVEVE